MSVLSNGVPVSVVRSARPAPGAAASSGDDATARWLRTLGRLLRCEGNRVNDKRVYRFYRSEGLSLRVKRRRRQAAYARVVPQPAMRPWQRWAMDFMSDSTNIDNGPGAQTVAGLPPRAARSSGCARVCRARRAQVGKSRRARPVPRLLWHGA
ncbi:MAG TPA: hypothetical protein VFU21_18895 [Kofleriaceae bacterium]|nr:hypothetical protein [Kofleriaceae bacterium]